MTLLIRSHSKAPWRTNTMKSTKLLAILLLISCILAFTGCDVLSQYIPYLKGMETTPDTEDPTNNNTTTDTPGNGGGNVDVKDFISFINVIMVNDNHGMLNEADGGIDKIAAGISYYEKLGEVIKIANGDMFQGTYVSSTLRGLPMLDVLNELDFDAFVIVNHEFDWGLDEMKKYKDGDPTNGEAEFPFLGANIYDKRTGKMVDWLEPYTVVEVGNVKIGIIGIIGQVEGSILATHVADYDFVDPENIVKELAAELRGAKDCDVVLVACHGDDNFTNSGIAELTGASRIDGVFTGHTHYSTDNEVTRADGKKLCILQNGGYGDSFATLKLTFDKDGNLTNTDGKLNYTYKYTAGEHLSSVFAKYEQFMRIGDTVLFTADEYVSKYDIGIEVAHSMYLTYGTDFAVINSGGVRTGIDAGEVTYADIFQILPFENEVYVVTLSGEMLRSYLNNSGGIYYWGIGIDNLHNGEYYTLAIVDYVYVGYTFDDYRNDTCVDTNDLIRDVFIEYIMSLV